MLLSRQLWRLWPRWSVLRAASSASWPRISARMGRMEGLVDVINHYDFVSSTLKTQRARETESCEAVLADLHSLKSSDLDLLVTVLNGCAGSVDQLSKLDKRVAQLLTNSEATRVVDVDKKKNAEQVNKLLTIASHFHFSSLQTSLSVKTVIRMCCSSSLFPSLSSSQLVFLLLLMSEHRLMPLRDHDYSDYTLVPSVLAVRLEQIAEQLSLNEMAVVCHALYKLRLHMSPQQPVFTKAVFEALIDMKNEQVATLSPQISELLKMLRMRGDCDWALISRLMVKYEAVIGNLSYYAKSRMLSLVITGSVPNPHGFINAFMDDLERHVNELRDKDLEALLFALHFSNFHLGEGQSQVLLRCLKAVISNRKEHILAVRSQIKILYIMSCMHTNEQLINTFGPFIDSLTQKANEMKPDFLRARNMSQAVEVFRRLCETFVYDSQPSKTKRRVSTRGDSEYVKQFATTMINLADIHINLELQPCATGTCVTLDEDLRKHLLKFRFVAKEDSESSNIRMLNEAHKTLEKVLRTPVLKTRIMPNHGQLSLVFALQKHSEGELSNISLSRASKPVPKFIACKNEQELPRCSNQSDPCTDVFVMLVPKRSHFNGNGDASGEVKLHVKQLKQLGFKVIALRVYSFQKALTNHKETKMLVSLIKNQWIGPLPSRNCHKSD